MWDYKGLSNQFNVAIHSEGSIQRARNAECKLYVALDWIRWPRQASGTTY
jgi:hypothetical protein